MQNAKDSFYVMLRDRIAGGNPARQVVVRGVQRPAVLVEENELVTATTPAETFVLRWTKAAADAQSATPLLQMECVIRYETAGSSGAAGMDRGRALAAMDAELLGALLAEPQRVTKTDSSVTPPTVLTTQVFWSSPLLGAIESVAERMGRSATVVVYSFAEMGDR